MIHTPPSRLRVSVSRQDRPVLTLKSHFTFAVIGRAIANVVTLPWRVWQIRGVLTAMADLSDRELRDIGLARQDLRDAVALPPGRSPTPLLASRVADRRRRA